MKTILLFAMLLCSSVALASCPVDAYPNFNPPDQAGTFDAQTVGTSSQPLEFGMLCAGADSASIRVALTGPFTLSDGSQSTELHPEYGADGMGRPLHFRVIFKPVAVGPATGTMTFTSLDGSTFVMKLKNPLPLNGVGQ